MEKEFGGAKPKTKFLRKREDSSEPNNHNCSKEKHKHRKSFSKSGKTKSDSNINNSFINEGADRVDDLDHLTHDTEGPLHDSGISICNDSLFLNDSGNAVRERYMNHGDSGISIGERTNRHGYSDPVITSLPPIMPEINLSEADCLADIDFRRTDNNIDGDDDDFVNDIEAFWKDMYDEKDKDKSGHKNHVRIERDRNKLKLGEGKAEKDAEKTLESKKQEVVKRHEDSLREKWKRSGLALRKFLSERLGLNSSIQREKLDNKMDKCHKQSGREIHKNESKPENTKNACDADTQRAIQHNNAFSSSQFEPDNKHVKKEKKHKQDKATRKDSISSETSSDKGSRSMLSRFKMSLRSKKKKTENESRILSDESYPSSPMSHSSSNNSCTSRLSHDPVPRLSCDHQNTQSQERDMLMNDFWIGDHDLIIALNLGGSDRQLCTCRMCQGQSFRQSIKDGKKCKKHQSSGEVQDTKNKKDKSRKFFRRGKSKKKEFVGILDHELSSLDGDPEQGRHHQKDYTRERLSSNSQDTATPENTPPRSFTTGSTSEVLSGLHFAIPYLPPRLRQRLQESGQNESASSHGNRTNDNGGSGLSSAQNRNDSNKKKCLKAKSGLRSRDKHTKDRSSEYSRLIGGRNLDDFSNLDQDWENVLHSSERSNSPNQSLSTYPRGLSSSRTNGEISDNSVFSRLRRGPNSEAYRNNLIDSLDTPFVPPVTEELSIQGSNSIGTAKVDNSLYEFDNDNGLLQDLLDRMDSISPDRDGDGEGRQNGCFIPETESETKQDQENDSADGNGWFPLPIGESSDEADDEFECDCEHCSSLRQQNTSSDLSDLRDLGSQYEAGRQDEMRLGTENELLVPDPYIDEDIFNLNITELTSLDFMLMAESTFRLDIMLENVIQQMLAVQPELLTDHTVPPASQFTIDNLSSVSLTMDHIEQNPACPICLCPCELEEIMTVLVCSHLFHPLCINAWLAKSGTCPVCRSPV